MRAAAAAAACSDALLVVHLHGRLPLAVASLLLLLLLDGPIEQQGAAIVTVQDAPAALPPEHLEHALDLPPRRRLALLARAAAARDRLAQLAWQRLFQRRGRTAFSLCKGAAELDRVGLAAHLRVLAT